MSRRLALAGPLALALVLDTRPLPAHVFCGINATVDVTPRLAPDGATLTWVAEFCDGGLTGGDRVEWAVLPVDPLRFVPGSQAWLACPTGGCSIDADGALRLAAFTLAAGECIRFPFTLTLQPGQRGEDVCLRGPVRTRLQGGTIPCDRETDDPLLPGPEATCLTVEDLAPGCVITPAIDPTFFAGCAGGMVSVSAAASAQSGCPGGQLAFQWSRDGLPIAGATRATFDVPASEPPSGATYRSLVSCAGDPDCRNLTPPALVILLGPDTIEAPAAVCRGQAALVSVPSGATCSIDCGDGSPTVPSCTRNCAYAAAGSFTVVADARDGSNCQATLRRTIEVLAQPQACISPLATVCELRAAGPTHVLLPNCTAPGPVFTWTATLGTLDDPSAREPLLTLPDVAVATPFDLTLEGAVAGCGAPAQAVRSVTLLPAVEVAPEVLPHPACAGARMTFRTPPPAGTGPFEYLWDFGDSSSSPDPEPTHTYAGGGIYAASLAILDCGTGCTSRAPLDVIVWDPCCASSLTAVARVRAVRVAATSDVQVSWDRLGGATGGYAAWVTGDKTLLPLARDPGGAGIDRLCGPTPALDCIDAGGLLPAAGALRLYQVRGVCGGLEGP